MLFGSSEKNVMAFHKLEVINGRPVIKPPKAVFDKGSDRWKHALVGQFVGGKVLLPKIYSTANFLWGKRGHVRILELQNEMILFDFATAKGRDWALNNGPWHINHIPLILRPWKKDIENIEFALKKPPVWVKLSKIPLQLMTCEGLSYLGSGLGVPICLEKIAKHITIVCVELISTGVNPNDTDVLLEDGAMVKVLVEHPWAKQQIIKKAQKQWVRKEVSVEKSTVHKVPQAPKDVMVESKIEEGSTKVMEESASIIVSKSPQKVKYSEVIHVLRKEGNNKKSGVGLSSTTVATPVIESPNYLVVLNT
ncbi:hypothetical protein CRG98_001743 [Punica granatum]|uniref:DUF4283 domain-containing protein n=1 Tax=Punica granatum TaxID=22663 RepID=A0A2I0LCD6_PUNGR|nr:hypothetical protein CRG98_001743 [Punica granatum]